MIPKISLFGLMINTYTVMAGMAAITFMAMSFRPLRRSGLSVGGVIVLYIAVCITFVIGARLWNVAVDPDSYNKTRPWYSLRIGGFSTYGGITGALIILNMKPGCGCWD